MKSVIYSLSNLGTRLLLYPVAFFASMFIARYLGPEEKGIYAFILIIISFLIPFLSLGIGGGITYYVSSEKYKPKDVAATVFLLSIGIGFINGAALFLAWHFQWLGEMNNQISLEQVCLLQLVLLFSSIYFFISRMARGASRFHTLNLLEAVKTIANPIIMISLVYFLALRIDGVVYGLILLNGLIALGLCWRVYQKYRPIAIFRFDFIRDCFGYGLKGWMGDMAIKANVRLDQLILGSVVTATSLGIYAVGVLLVEMLWIIPDSVGSVLFNRIAMEQNSVAKVAMTEQVHRILFFSALLLAVGWGVFCVYVVIPYGYGEAYLGSILPFLLLIPGTVLYVPTKVMTKLMSGSGRILDTTKATVFGSLISIGLYLILIPRYGIWGAAIASSVGCISISAACLYLSVKHFGVSLNRLIIPTKADVNWITSQLDNLQKMARKKLKA